MKCGHFKQLSLNKFFDPSTPSMRKGRDGEKKWNGKKNGMENNGENSGPLTSIASRPPNGDRLQRRPLVLMFP